MLAENILPIFVILQGALSYHFYNHATHQVLTRMSLDNIPSGYKLIPPPKNRKRRLQRLSANGVCTDAGFTCKTPFEKYLTYQYECDADYQCPRQYKCCSQKCFQHKICSKVKATSDIRSSYSSGTRSKSQSCGRRNCGTTYNRPGTCEKWPYNCPKPYDYSLTSIFKCERDRQCPRSFKCCQQSCFSHKICSRIVINNDSPETVTVPIKTTPIEVPVEFKYPNVEQQQVEIGKESTQSFWQKVKPIEAVEVASPDVGTREETIIDETTTEETTTKIVTTEITTTVEATTEETTAEPTTTVATTTEETTTEPTTTIETTAVEVTTEEATTKIEAETLPATLDLIPEKEPTEIEVTDARTTTAPFAKSTPDANAIIPEYSDYYYHYDTGNNSTTEEYDEDDDADDDEYAVID